MNISKQDLLTAAQELIDVLGLVNNQEDKIPVEVTEKTSDEELKNLIIKAAPMLEPSDKLHEITSDIVKELTKIPDLMPLSLEEDIEKFDTLKELRALVRANAVFKPLEEKLQTYKDVIKLKEDMLNLLILGDTPDEAEDEIIEQNTVTEPPKNDSEALSPEVSIETSKMMKVAKIKTKEPFRSLFKVSPDTLDKIEKSMLQHDFDFAFPLILWGDVVIDGHTRLAAAMRAGIGSVPVEVKEFKTEKEALDYAIHNQRDRRNLSDAELLQFIELTDEVLTPQEAGKKETKEGPTVKITAEKLGISTSKVAEARAVLKDEKATKAVKSGKKTIHRAAKEIAKKDNILKNRMRGPGPRRTIERSRLEAIAQTMKERYNGKTVAISEIIEEADILFISWGGVSSLGLMKGTWSIVFDIIKAFGVVVDDGGGKIKVKEF
jgi:ParB family chromosome partitioning protein